MNPWPHPNCLNSMTLCHITTLVAQSPYTHVILWPSTYFVTTLSPRIKWLFNFGVLTGEIRMKWFWRIHLTSSSFVYSNSYTLNSLSVQRKKCNICESARYDNLWVGYTLISNTNLKFHIIGTTDTTMSRLSTRWHTTVESIERSHLKSLFRSLEDTQMSSKLRLHEEYFMEWY